MASLPKHIASTVLGRSRHAQQVRGVSQQSGVPSLLSPGLSDRSSPFDLHGQVAVVTGSGRGLGKVMATGLADARASVVVCSRTANEIERTVADLAARGADVAGTCVDTRKPESCQALVAFTMRRFGKLNILVNNAAVDRQHPAEVLALAAYREVIDTNLLGYFNCATSVGREMLRAGEGSIINVSSIASLISLDGSVAYASAKAGVNMLTRVMACEWADRGVRVNALAPGYMTHLMTGAPDPRRCGATDPQAALTPMRRRGLPEELIGPLVFLASSASSFVTGQILVVDGGYTAV